MGSSFRDPEAFVFGETLGYIYRISAISDGVNMVASKTEEFKPEYQRLAILGRVLSQNGKAASALRSWRFSRSHSPRSPSICRC